MTTEEIKRKVFEIVATVCNVEVSEVNENSTVGDFDAWDSLAQMTILQNVQDEFDVEFEPEDMIEIEDIKDIVNTVESKL